MLLAACVVMAQGQRHRFSRVAFTTETPMVHDPVMAFEDSTWYIFATGMGIQQMTSTDRQNWTVLPDPVMSVIPKWTHDSVPGFRSHVWAPDIIWDRDTQEYVLHWSSSHADNDYGPKAIYASRTTDFRHFSEPELFYRKKDSGVMELS